MRSGHVILTENTPQDEAYCLHPRKWQAMDKDVVAQQT